MGSISESFQQLSEVLLAEAQKPITTRPTESVLLWQRLLRVVLPAAVRISSGSIVDIRDRQVGPFDLIASLDAYPIFGDERVSIVPADAVIFCLQVRSLEASNLSEFGTTAASLRKLESQSPAPTFCAAVVFGLLPLLELSEFMKGSEGQAVDGVLSLGHHFIVRNSQGWYGDTKAVPFVTERDAGAAFKAFTFLLLNIAQARLGQPFVASAYQHL